MDAAPALAPLKYRRWLPYWAVLRTDLKQTLRSWVYRLWVVVSILAAVGYLLYRFGVHREAGIIQSASVHTSDLLRGIVLGSLALIVVLTVSSIGSERGTLADSVLSRGISRYQYFLAKWHARTFVVVVTFVVIASVVLLGSSLLLSEDLTFTGSVMAVLTVAVVLAAVVAWGVALGALANSTVVGITVLGRALRLRFPDDDAAIDVSVARPHAPAASLHASGPIQRGRARRADGVRSGGSTSRGRRWYDRVFAERCLSGRLTCYAISAKARTSSESGDAGG